MISFQAYKQKRFLIVDDFDNFILSMRQILRSLGAEHIDSARSGQEAISHCLHTHYDVVLCDYNMGSSQKNGQQVLEELRHRKLLKSTAIFIMVSAEVAKDMVYGALESQPDGYLAKPISQSQLEKRLSLLMEQKQALKPILEAMDLEDYGKAITLCHDEIKRNSKYKSWCIKTLANLYYLSGDLTHAREIYQDVINQRPLDWARLGLGKIQLAEQDYEGAIATLSGLLEDNNQCIEAYDWLARAYQKQGNLQKAQRTLAQAVEISPRVLQRQKTLAEISLGNQDLETATRAYRATARLSDNSIHESPEIYLSFSRCLSDLSESDSSKVSDVMANEALKSLEKTRAKYGDRPGVKLQALMVETRVYASQGKSELSQRAFKQAKELFDELENPNPEWALEMAQTLYSLQEPAQAQKLLVELGERHPDDAALRAKIEELLEEPVGLKEKMQARESNRQGIKAYEQGNYPEAIQHFQAALSITPRHKALNLNLVQALIKVFEETQASPRLLDHCDNALQRVGNLDEQHRQYKRWQYLTNKLQSIKHKLNGATQ